MNPVSALKLRTKIITPNFSEKKYGKNGILNKVTHLDSAAHNWYRFVLSFPPHLVREYLTAFGATKNSVVLDPFCGTGTTLVEAKKLGVNSVGIEAHPMTYFASKTKTNWDMDPIKFINDAKCVLGHFFEHLKGRKLRTLEADKMKLLLKNSISPLPLHKSLLLLDTINAVGSDSCKNHEILAFAKTLVSNASNIYFGPEVGVRKQKKEDADVANLWFKEIELMAQDLNNLKELNNCSAQVINEDSRNIANVLPPQSIDFVITSPPYPNEKDYTRTTRLESVVLGYINNREELRNLKYSLVRSNTRGVYKKDCDHEWISKNDDIRKICTEIEDKRIELGKTSGFEKNYARVTELYFGGMAKHFSSLRKVLKPGALLAYVVGDQASYLRVMIRTGQLLADIAQELGYEVISIDLFRKRFSTATGAELREEVVVLRWPGL